MKSDMQNLLQSQGQAWLQECRAEARKLLRSRSYITVEDVLAVCERPSYVHRNLTGNIFRDSDFVMDGWTPARKASSNRRWIMKWRLRERPLPMMRFIRRARQSEMVE